MLQQVVTVLYCTERSASTVQFSIYVGRQTARLASLASGKTENELREIGLAEAYTKQ